MMAAMGVVRVAAPPHMAARFFQAPGWRRF